MHVSNNLFIIIYILVHCQINFTDLKKMRLRSKYVPSLSFVTSVTPSALGGIFDI